MLVYKETRYPARIHARICMSAREQRRDIDINRGQGRAGACFVIRAPLTSKVVNLCENVARIDGRFEPAISELLARSRHAFYSSYPSYPTRDITRWRHPPRGVRTCRATYGTSNYAKTWSDIPNDGYTRPVRITTIALFAFDRPTIFSYHPIATNVRSPINSLRAKDYSDDAYRSRSRDISAPYLYYLCYFKSISIISLISIL